MLERIESPTRSFASSPSWRTRPEGRTATPSPCWPAGQNRPPAQRSTWPRARNGRTERVAEIQHQLEQVKIELGV
jgi:hypothetical protein